MDHATDLLTAPVSGALSLVAHNLHDLRVEGRRVLFHVFGVPCHMPRPPRRFEFSAKAPSLKAFVAELEPLTDEVTVVANDAGWHVTAVDPAHVAMIELHPPDLIDCFERVLGTNTLERVPEDIRFGLDLVKLKDVLKAAKKDDAVYMVMDLPDGDDKDRITVDVGRTKRTMPAIDTAGMADPTFPPLDLPARFTVRTQEILEAVRACEAVSDHVRLTVSRDNLNVLAEGDTDKVSLDLAVDVAYVKTDGGTATSLFPLDYLGKFVKAVGPRGGKVEALTVQLGTDLPIRVDWDGATKGTWLCAPRIETTE